MMSPRSFMYINHAPPSPRRPSSPSSSHLSTATTSATTSTTTSPATTALSSPSTSPRSHASYADRRRSSPQDDNVRDRSSLASPSIAQPVAPTATNTTTAATTLAMGTKRREPQPLRKDSSTTKLAFLAASPPRTTTSLSSVRPSTPTSPVQIPQSKTKQSAAHHHGAKRLHGAARRSSARPGAADAIPPSVVALLAMTDIPPHRAGGRPRGGGRHRSPTSAPRMTVDAIIEKQEGSEQELSWRLGAREPLQMLLSPPDEDLDEDDLSVPSDSAIGSALSTRTVSLESMPSLGESFATDGLSSVETPLAGGHFSPRGRKSRPTRRSLEPISSPPGEREDHPLSPEDEDDMMSILLPLDLEKLEMLHFETPLSGRISPSDDGDESSSHVEDEEDDKKAPLPDSSAALPLFPFRPLKTAFKSNLTASLRALRSAARSLSALNFPSIPPDDLLTRSLLTMDPKVPYTDERRPPVLEEEPSAELRRYLNPTTRARILETTSAAKVSASSGNGSSTAAMRNGFTASIQMQTYKVQRSRSAPPTSRTGVTPPGSASTSSMYNVTSSSASASTRDYRPKRTQYGQTAFSYPPGVVRQRDLRENSDFIRVAVLEMLMRNAGKLDDNRPGRARWALPPRKPCVQPYEIGADGVPARWVPLTR